MMHEHVSKISAHNQDLWLGTLQGTNIGSWVDHGLLLVRYHFNLFEQIYCIDSYQVLCVRDMRCDAMHVRFDSTLNIITFVMKIQLDFWKYLLLLVVSVR